MVGDFKNAGQEYSRAPAVKAVKTIEKTAAGAVRLSKLVEVFNPETIRLAVNVARDRI